MDNEDFFSNYIENSLDPRENTNNNRKIRQTITIETIKTIRKYLDKNCTAKEISENIDISISAVYHLIGKISNGLEDSQILSARKGRPKLNNLRIKNNISNMLLQDSSYIQKEIKEELTKKGINKSQSTISRILKDMDFTRKRLVRIPEERNSLGTLNIRLEYARKIQFLANENIVFLDETGVNMHISRNYGYSPKNLKAYKVVKGNKGVNISCLVTIKTTGILEFEIKDGAFDGDALIAFIENKLIFHFRNNPNDVLVMDNCKFHHRRDVISTLNSNNIKYIFLLPYSPQLKAIEEYFSHFKSLLKSANISLSDRNNLKAKINEILNNETINFNGWFNNMRKYVEKALSKQEFI